MSTTLNDFLSGRSMLTSNVEMPSGLRQAFLFLEQLLPLLDSQIKIMVTPYFSDKACGLYFHAYMVGRVVRFGSHVSSSDGVMTIGMNDDFEYPSRKLLTNAESRLTSNESIEQMARRAAEYFNRE